MGLQPCIYAKNITTYYIYSGDNILAEYDGSGALTNKYIYAGNERIAVRQTTGNKLLFYLKDHLGSSRVIVDTTGKITAKHNYYPFGDNLSSSVSQGSEYKYTGKELDEEGGFNLYYYGARYYDAKVGRFTSVDPLAEKSSGWSPYVYTLDNPLKFNDPEGEDAKLSLEGYQKTREGLKEHLPGFLVDLLVPEKPDLGYTPVPLTTKAEQLAMNRLAGSEAQKFVKNSLIKAGESFKEHVRIGSGKGSSILDIVLTKSKDAIEIKGIDWAARSYQDGGSGLKSLLNKLGKQIDKYMGVLQKGQKLTVTFVGKPENKNIVTQVQAFTERHGATVKWIGDITR